MLASLTDWQSRTTTFGYDTNSRRTSITRPNGVVSTYGYDAASRTTSIVHALSGTTLQSFSYAYDNADNRTSVTYGGATESYVLDALNRLTSVTYPGGTTTSYTYDANGNRATKVAGGVTTTYTYDNAGQLTSEANSGGGGTTAYTYDAAGNQTARGTDTFTWDYANRMSGATVGGTAATYTYDADGVRTKKVVAGTPTNFVWDRETGLPKLVDDGTKAYLQDDGLIAEIDGSNIASYGLGDAIHSIRGLTDGSGTTTGTSDYDVYGGVRASTGTNGSFRFTGEQTDAETGFTFLRARYLDPAIGRLSSADTVQPNASGTQGWNLYAYAAGNPTRWTDPTGHVAVGGYFSVNPIQLAPAALVEACYVTGWCAPLLVRALAIMASPTLWRGAGVTIGALALLACAMDIVEYKLAGDKPTRTPCGLLYKKFDERERENTKPTTDPPPGPVDPPPPICPPGAGIPGCDDPPERPKCEALNAGAAPIMTDADVVHIAEGHTEGGPDEGNKFRGWRYHEIVTDAGEFQAFREYLVRIMRNARRSAGWVWNDKNQNCELLVRNPDGSGAVKVIADPGPPPTLRTMFPTAGGLRE